MIRALDDTYPVSRMCACLDVTRSKYYAWSARGGVSRREQEDCRLSVLMRRIHADSNGILGYRRMLDVLQMEHGEKQGEFRTRRLMRENTLWGVPLKKRHHRRVRIVDVEIPDLVQRDFTASQPNQVWVSDLSEVVTAEGKLYLCMIKDLYDGVVIAWKLGRRQTAKLVTETVELAVGARLDGERPVLHSDHGSQYTSKTYRECLERHGLQMSMGEVRTCADNASAESVFSQLKRELIYRTRYRTHEEAIKNINDYYIKIHNPLKRIKLSKKELKQLAKLGEEETKEDNFEH